MTTTEHGVRPTTSTTTEYDYEYGLRPVEGSSDYEYDHGVRIRVRRTDFDRASYDYGVRSTTEHEYDYEYRASFRGEDVDLGPERYGTSADTASARLRMHRACAEHAPCMHRSCKVHAPCMHVVHIRSRPGLLIRRRARNPIISAFVLPISGGPPPPDPNVYVLCPRRRASSTGSWEEWREAPPFMLHYAEKARKRNG